ncbi:MAG: rod-binding protein [Acetivibrionales bacterium]|jgi:flagellar protein FlgJ
MKIDGFGQINPADSIKANKAKTEASDFESVLKKAFDEGDKAKLKEACNEFESVMLQILYKQMKATVPEGGLTEKSSARAIFEDMLDETLMERSSQRGMGISDMMYKQLSAQMDKRYRIRPKEEDTGSNTEPTAQENFDPDKPDLKEDMEPDTGPDGVELVEK